MINQVKQAGLAWQEKQADPSGKVRWVRLSKLARLAGPHRQVRQAMLIR